MKKCKILTRFTGVYPMLVTLFTAPRPEPGPLDQPNYW